jgi:DNA-binding transcriptional LysR family regulator
LTNIPTDLLRTLIAVVDLRSFTKAAASVGVTQPAVSAQIKRLQLLIGGDLLDRSTPGVSLT